jgi:hypothetical protein
VRRRLSSGRETKFRIRKRGGLKKMGKFVKTFFILTLTAGAAVGAEAHGGAGRRTPGVDRREHRQQRRIVRGVRSDELTARETLRLERGQWDIRRDERRAKADGRVTARERAHLQRELNRESRHIYRAKHNDTGTRK